MTFFEVIDLIKRYREIGVERDTIAEEEDLTYFNFWLRFPILILWLISDPYFTFVMWSWKQEGVAKWS